MTDRIRSKYQVSSLINDLLKIQNELNTQQWSENVPQWNRKRKVKYANGVVQGKYNEQDQEMLSTLKRGVEDQALRDELSKSLSYKIRKLKRKDKLDLMNTEKLKNDKKAINELRQLSVDDWLKKEYTYRYKKMQPIIWEEFRTFIFIEYAYLNICRERRSPYCTDYDQLYSIYNDIFGKCAQFKKYGLLPIDDDRELMIIDPPRIYDKAINRTIFVKNVPKELLIQINLLAEEGLIGEWSVRGSNYNIYEGKAELTYLCEAVERGTVFDCFQLGVCSITKLYSEKYENTLWININDQNITFEEMCEDFNVYNEKIVTQVLHLQYIIEKDEAFITHLDHEYIFYTFEEYYARLTDATQKGSAHPKIKSFKIDNAKIPFFYQCSFRNLDEQGNKLPKENEQFLYYVLECYFSHKDLLKEYFDKIL